MAVESVSRVVSAVNGRLGGFIWGPVMLALFLLVGLMFTLRSGVFQISRFKMWMNATFLAIFKNAGVRRTGDAHAISQFQSLCTALAATIGTGNIAGVATAIASGGPGAVFWMWFSAFLGMMTVFAENTLGIKYRYKNARGQWVGGAMVYLERGLGSRFLAVAFSVFCALASFGIGNMTQGNSIAVGLRAAFGVDTRITAVVIMALSALVILGGIKRIAGVAEKFVPFMAIFYIVGGLAVILINFRAVPGAFAQIFREAFNFRAASGGALGYGIAAAMRRGISRGVFSNEAGLGSSVMVHSSSDVKEPVVQGMWGIFEVFADTIVVCTVTALTILCSGVYNMRDYISGASDLTGTALTSAAFESALPLGGQFVAVALVLFAFSTILGWSFYGERAAEYLFGLRAVTPYRVAFVLMIYVGCVTSLELVWGVADTLNGFMAIPNLIGLILLRGEVFGMTRDYLERNARRYRHKRK
jgi:AGCS family alanine or glycine:cation symporter